MIHKSKYLQVKICVQLATEHRLKVWIKSSSWIVFPQVLHGQIHFILYIAITFWGQMIWGITLQLKASKLLSRAASPQLFLITAPPLSSTQQYN